MTIIRRLITSSNRYRKLNALNHNNISREINTMSEVSLKTKTFIDKVKAKNHANHKDANGDWLYEYDKTVYKNSTSKIIITCKIHGDFDQNSNNHLQGQGCMLCASTQKRGTTKDFIDKSVTIHGDKYKYTKTIYEVNFLKVIITCSLHGDFTQTPADHLEGKGCSDCGKDASKLKLTSTTSNFIEKASKIHNFLYTYKSTEYTKAVIKVIITCKLHGDFRQTPASHLNGNGCPTCASLTRGYSKTDFRSQCEKNNEGLGVLYIIRCFNRSESFYKIGRTSKTTQLRYNDKTKMPYNYEIIHEFILDSDTAYDLENDIFRELVDYKYKPLLSFGGQTECFSSIESIKEYFEYLETESSSVSA